MHIHGLISTAASIALNTLYSISAPPIASNGCGKPLPSGLKPGGASINFTLNSEDGGGERRYLLHLPEKFSQRNRKPAPLIVVLHAFNQHTGSIEDITRFSNSDTNTEYISVYPEGINGAWFGSPAAPNSSVIDDRQFINDLLDTLEYTLCIDKARIYATGLSNGGGLSGLLACYPLTLKRFAAFSGVSAAYTAKESLGYSLFEEEGCDSGDRSRSTPFLAIHGDSDGVITYHGDNSNLDIHRNNNIDLDTLPIPQWLQDWASRNGCPSPANLTIGNSLDTGDIANATSWVHNETIQRSTWTCNGRREVVIGYYVKGLGHGWPSTVPLDERFEALRLGPTTWNASALLMEWFGMWTLLSHK